MSEVKRYPCIMMVHVDERNPTNSHTDIRSLSTNARLSFAHHSAALDITLRARKRGLVTDFEKRFSLAYKIYMERIGPQWDRVQPRDVGHPDLGRSREVLLSRLEMVAFKVLTNFAPYTYSNRRF